MRRPGNAVCGSHGGQVVTVGPACRGVVEVAGNTPWKGQRRHDSRGRGLAGKRREAEVGVARESRHGGRHMRNTKP